MAPNHSQKIFSPKYTGVPSSKIYRQHEIPPSGKSQDQKTEELGSEERPHMKFKDII